jgi:uncharacterized membrane protein
MGRVLNKKNKLLPPGQGNQPASQTPTPHFLTPEMSQQILGTGAQPVLVSQTQVTHAGPLPSPDVFAGYEKVLSGSADRIIKMAESEQMHRQTLDRRQQWHRAGLTFVGQLFAFLIGMSGIGGGIYLVKSDKSISGFSVFFTSLAALIGVFIYSRRDTSQPKKQAAAVVDK